MAFGLGSVESVATQSFEPFDLEHHLGLLLRLLQPSMGILLLQLFYEQLTFESCDLVLNGLQSDWLLNLMLFGPLVGLPKLPSV